MFPDPDQYLTAYEISLFFESVGVRNRVSAEQLEALSFPIRIDLPPVQGLMPAYFAPYAC